MYSYYNCTCCFRDNTPTDVMMTKNEWIMLVVVWNVFEREIKLYKNGELAFTMNTNDRLEYPDKVVLSVKEDTCELYKNIVDIHPVP